jgi:hypothetical protein
MDTRHPQVPVLWFKCDEEISELITLINRCGATTANSCQDNGGGRGAVRRVWVEIFGERLLPLLGLLDRPEETGNRESLSNRIAFDWEPDDWQAFREDRSWHYTATVERTGGELMPLRISIRFPYTDLPEVVARLRSAAREIAGYQPDDEQPPAPPQQDP